MEEKTHSSSERASCDQTLLTSNRIQGAITLVLILLAAFLFASTINALKEYRYIGGGISPTNTVRITGEGEVFVKPDVAEFTVSIEEQATTAAEVEGQVSETMGALMEALTAAGVEEEAVQTVSYQLQPNYRFEPAVCPQFGRCERERIQDGFELTQDVRVRVSEIDTAGELISSVSELAVSRVSGLTFTIADEDAVRAEARRLAIADAREKAQTLAADLGVTFVRIVGFSENDIYMPVMRTMTDSAVKFGGDVEEASPEAMLPAGENKVTSRVGVIYEMR